MVSCATTRHNVHSPPSTKVLNNFQKSSTHNDLGLEPDFEKNPVVDFRDANPEVSILSIADEQV
ncbi:hypothetical protein E2562_009678 [Oryza meyeriana var. granulata]|uniref:Uncharacterized protein n=1 Tax=Oryza meyeriana var. granulata TaxID=110450 RepID=A0A6G1D1W2_9ORYZ|nr:hypothetical protein E2562_009678 [Oryza meyeriana var. granulata]